MLLINRKPNKLKINILKIGIKYKRNKALVFDSLFCNRLQRLIYSFLCVCVYIPGSLTQQSEGTQHKSCS